MRRLVAVSLQALKGETIKRVSYNNDMMPKLNAYNGYTLFTESGRELIVWNSMGETNLSEVKER